MNIKAPETIKRIFELLYELSTLSQEIILKQLEFTKIENRLLNICGKEYVDFKDILEDK